MAALPPELHLQQRSLLSFQTVIHGLVLAGSFLMYFAVTLVYNATCVTCNSPTNPYWVMEGQLSDPTFYLVCLLTPVMALLPRFVHGAVFFPELPASP